MYKMSQSNLIDKEISGYLTLLSPLQKKSVLSVVKTFAAESEDWWDKLSAIQQTEIDKSISEMKKGETISHKDVMKKYKKWQ